VTRILLREVERFVAREHGDGFDRYAGFRCGRVHANAPAVPAVLLRFGVGGLARPPTVSICLQPGVPKDIIDTNPQPTRLPDFLDMFGQPGQK
jgi:hypothetical protein